MRCLRPRCFRPGPDTRSCRPHGLLAAAAIAWLAAGCGRETVQVYQAPKDVAGTGQAMTAASAAAAGIPQSPPAGVPQVKWQLPAGWQELPAGQMRVGYFAIPGPDNQKAEVTIIPLPGLAGTDLDNVNRWRGQIGSPPITADELTKAAVKIPVGGSDGQLFDLEGATDKTPRLRMVAAILRREGTAWFFKMTGEDKLVSSQKAVFTKFLETLRFEAGTSPAAAVTAGTPAPTPSASAATAGATGGAQGGAVKPSFTVPATWKEQAPGAMQTARYVPEGAEGKADVSVAVLPGDGGGKLGNVNRWRRQLGLEPVAEADLAASLTALKIDGAENYLVDLADPASKRRMVAAAVVRGGQSWFYKLTGDDAIVTREKAAFVNFIESAKYAP